MLNFFLFSLLCLSWGSTWFAIKVGVESFPPLLFAATRFIAAGPLILIVAIMFHGFASIKLKKKDIFEITWLSFLIITICFSLIFWGEQYVSAGLTAIVVQGMIPIFLPFFSAWIHGEKITKLKRLSIVIGVIGIFVVFLPSFSVASWSDPSQLYPLLGLLAIVVGTLSYCYGSVRGKTFLNRHSAIAVAGWQNLIGGIIVLLFSILFEIKTANSFSLWDYVTVEVFYAWIWLVVFGSVLGFALYIVLLKSWGATNVSAYAFITPVVAIIIEYLLAGVIPNTTEFLGMIILFIAVALAFKKT